MRFGGPTFGGDSTPEKWIAAVQKQGYRAAYCPVKANAGDSVIKEYADAARQADIVIAEVGAWSNPISPDDEQRKKAIDYNIGQLALAEKIGARCCVNIAGSRNAGQWDGPHKDNLSMETFAMIVQTTQGIIDAVHPTRTTYSLEPMPWVFPDNAKTYLELIEAIDRPAFAAHLDPVNWMVSPRVFYYNGDFIEECFSLLGRHVKSCHLKDITLSGKLTVHLDEAAPGQGSLDYHTLLRELDRLDPDTPAMLEHLSNEQEYAQAAAYVRSVAAELGIML